MEALLEINLDESNTKVDDDEELLEYNSIQIEMRVGKGYWKNFELEPSVETVSWFETCTNFTKYL